ncbi:spermatogenesis-associated protein 31E1-like [Elephas maximus indicus]|uniref:spermatogenesis-associated protein 31E1-like n=1 Tax=Elephas maximus indicus TaxID=99487 RepID=UPI0021162454|nr:spermatogenesis-associated protein 31E1-like [Elephas maximus indicus]
MENYLCPLKSFSATWLSSSSTSWILEAIVGFLCGVGLFLLLLPYLQSNPPLPPPEKNINIKKPQVETFRRSRKNKRNTEKACRRCMKKLQEARGLVALLQTLLGKRPHEGSFHQRKRGEPFGPVRNRALAEARRRQRAEPAESAASVVSPCAARAPPTRPPCHLASTASAKPPEDLCDLKTEDSSGWITEDWTTDDSSDRKTAPESYSGNSYVLASSVPEITGLGCSSRPISALSWWWAAAKAFWIPTWKHCESQQEHTSEHPSKPASWGGRTDGSTKAESPSIPNPDVHKLLEIEIAKRVELKLSKEKDGSFKKRVSPDHHLNSLGTLKSLSHEQTTTVPRPYWSKPEQLSSPQELIYPKALGDHFHQKCNQLFWGLPSLHSESLLPTAWVSGSSSPLQSPPVLFNRISSACPVQVSSVCSQPQPLPHPEDQPQAPPLAPVLTQTPVLSSFQIPPPSSTDQVRAYEVSCPSSETETQSLTSTEIQHLESPLSQKQLKSGRALPSVAKGSQRAFSPFSPNLPQESGASEAYKSDFIIPGDVLSRTELQKQMEEYIQERLTHHKQSLPSRIQVSLERAKPWGELPRTGQSKDQHEPSWPSVFIGESSKDVKKVGSSNQKSCNFQLGKELGKDLGQVPKYDISPGSEESPVKVLQTNSEKELKSDSTSYTRNNTKNYKPRKPAKKQLEKTLEVPVGRELGQIMEGQSPLRVSHSWLAANHSLPKSATQQAHHESTTQEFSFLTPSTWKALEAHIKRFVRHKWDLSVQVGEPMNLSLSETQSSPPSMYGFHSSPPPESWTCSRAKTASIQRENPQACRGERATPKMSDPTRAIPLPSPSPVREEVQVTLRQTPPSRAKETREALVAKGSYAPQLQDRDISETSVLAKSQNINVDLRGLEAPGTSKSPSPPRMSVQDPVLSEEIKRELETANQPQGCPAGMLLLDHATKMILQHCATDVLLVSDIVASQSSHYHLKRVTSRDMPASKVLHEFMAAGGSSLGQQDPKTPKLQDPWRSQSKISAPSDETKDVRRWKTKVCEEGLARSRASPASGMSQPGQDKRSVESLGITSPQLSAEKGHAPPEGHFKKRMSSFIQSICSNKKGKGRGDPLQKGKPASASAQSHGPVKSRSVFMDRGATEAQTLMTAVGLILIEKFRLQQELYASKLNQPTEAIQESQDSVGGHASFHRAPSFPEHRREMNDTGCHYQVILEGQSSIGNKGTHDRHTNPYTTVKFKIGDRPLPSQGNSSSKDGNLQLCDVGGEPGRLLRAVFSPLSGPVPGLPTSDTGESQLQGHHSQGGDFRSRRCHDIDDDGGPPGVAQHQVLSSTSQSGHQSPRAQLLVPSSSPHSQVLPLGPDSEAASRVGATVRAEPASAGGAGGL